MNVYTYLYWGISKSLLSEVEQRLSEKGYLVKFENKGSTISLLSLKTSARKVMVNGVILLQSEYDNIQAKSYQLQKEVLDKILIADDLDSLIKVFENEFNVDLSLSNSVVEEPIIEEEVVGGPTPVIETSSVSVEDEEDELVSSVTDSDVPVEDLLDELEDLRFRNEFLESELSRLKSNSKNVDSDEELKKAETTIANLTKEKASLESNIRSLKIKLSEETSFISELQERVSNLTSIRMALESQLESAKENVKEELPTIKVPSNVTFYVSTSSLSIAHSYQHLLAKEEDAILIDLSLESFTDMLVKLTLPVRVTKWLLEGINLRTMFSKFEKTNCKVANGLSLVTSPSVVLSDNVLEKADWVTCLEQAEETGRTVMIYLGLENHQGVSELISRLSSDVVAIRQDTPAELRAFKKLKFKHDNVRELVI